MEVKAQKDIDFPFPEIKLTQLPELLTGHWEYDYSFNSDSSFKMTGEYIQAHYVPYRIEFNKTSDKADKKIVKEFPWLSVYRKTSCLKEHEFWVDHKGIMRYPKLVSNKTDSRGFLLECKIELANKRYPMEREYMLIQSISKGILIISKYQSDKRTDMHVYVREQQLAKSKKDD